MVLPGLQTPLQLENIKKISESVVCNLESAIFTPKKTILIFKGMLTDDNTL